MALPTDCRQSELLQLRVSDVKTEGGIVYLEITDVGEAQSVKTDSSRRKVPLHPAIREEFLAYVEKQKDHVFPGERSAPYSKRFNWMVDDLGHTDPNVDFHSLRHTFKTLCRVAGVSKELDDKLTGHALQNVGDEYRETPLETLAAAMKRVKY